MNDLQSLAEDIVTYSFPDDTGRFPVSFISGWLETHIGELNGLTHEDFFIDETGGIGPSGLMPVEKDIFKALYEEEYYERAAREALRGIVWLEGNADSVTMVKEGDTTIQKVSKHQISRTFSEFAAAARGNLEELLFQYNMQKSSPIGVDSVEGLADTEYNCFNHDH